MTLTIIIVIIIIMIIIIITMLTGRFSTSFTANWQNCYRKFGSFASLADLLPGLADLLLSLADLLPSDLFTGRFATKGNESRGCDRVNEALMCHLLRRWKRQTCNLAEILV